jgi:hypothetical protein
MAGNPCNIIPDQEIVLEGGAKLVPAPEAADAGKVLGVINQEGGIGWVEDQSGTLVQQQANWAETDDQSVSFIQNKPDLSVYATTSAVNTALAGKQDVINDLSDIRSGASAGATAVQPAALSDYATTSAMNTALAGKQDVINDLSDIRAGAAKGETAVQPADLPSTDELVPSSTSVDAGKVLTVDSNGDAGWQTPSSVTVDQSYNASSTNAQSGVAVAQAIASIPSSSYTAGDGIEIDNNKIAVRAGKNLDFANELVSVQLYSPLYEYHGNWAWSVIGPLNMTRIVQLRQGMTIKMKAGASLEMGGADGGAHFAICRKNIANGPEISGGSIVLVADAALTTDTSHNFLMRAGDTYVADFSTLSEKSVGSFNDIDDDNVDEFYLTVISYSAYTTVNNSRYIAGPILDYPGDLVNTAEYYTENPSIKELVAVDQLPASTSADENKVLKVDSNGNPSWGSDGFTTTAGITDIQVVNALPASPVATVLYMIPEA